MDYSQYTITLFASLIQALEKLNKLPTVLTLFVIDDSHKVVGTITDGDVRRGLIAGLKLDSPISDFMHRNFSYLSENENNFVKLSQFRQLKLKVVPLLDAKGRLIKIYDFSKTKSILPIDAVIMAGGKGERLKPLTITKPKPLLKIGGKEIIAYNYDRLYQFGITNQYVTINYLAEQIVEFSKSYNAEIKFNFVFEESFLGTAGALSLIPDFKNDAILLMNSDLLTNIDYEDFYKAFIEKDADMMVASIPYEINLPYAILQTEDRVVTSFREKPSYTYYANAGIYLFKKKVLKFIPQNKVYNATDLMDDVVKNNLQLLHYPITSYWLDIGKPEDYEKAQKDIAHIDFD